MREFTVHPVPQSRAVVTLGQNIGDRLFGSLDSILFQKFPYLCDKFAHFRSIRRI